MGAFVVLFQYHRDKVFGVYTAGFKNRNPKNLAKEKTKKQKNMKDNIYLETQGTKGGNTQSKNVGYVLISLRHQQDRITIDDFEGHGATYKQRELQQIQIIQNGEILFEGDKYELFDILKNAKKDSEQTHK